MPGFGEEDAEDGDIAHQFTVPSLVGHPGVHAVQTAEQRVGVS